MLFKNKVVRNIIYYGVGDFVVTGVTAFLFIPLYIKYLSIEDYGVFNVLNTNTTLFTYIFQLGIISAFARIYYIRKSEGKEKNYISNIILLHIVYSFTLFVFIYIFKQFIFSNLSPAIKDNRLLTYPVAIAFFSFLPALYYIYLRVEEKAIIFVRYQFLHIAVISILLFASLYFYKISLLVVIVCFSITAIILWVIIMIKFIPFFSLKLDFIDIKDTVKFSFPIFISYLAYFFISKYSIVILQKHISLKEIGAFALAQQIATIPSLITIAISKAIQPYLFSSNSKHELVVKIKKIDSNYKLIMVWIVGSMIFSVDIVFSYFLPNSYYEMRNIAKYLLLASLIYNFSIVENSILLYYMKTNIILFITIIGSVLNIILSNIFVYKYSIMGVVVAMTISFSVNFILDIFYSSKHIKFQYNIKSLSICIAIIFVFLIISSTSLVSIYYSFRIVFALLSLAMLTFVVALFLKKSNYEFIEKTGAKV